MHRGGTAITYRDGVLAADTLALFGDIKVLDDVKIQLVGDPVQFVFGMSGNACPSNALFSRWLLDKSSCDISSYDFNALTVTKDGVFTVGERGDWDPVPKDFWAVGSGATVAFGAMEQGATAEQAVAAAIKWCPLVGGEVRSVNVNLLNWKSTEPSGS